MKHILNKHIFFYALFFFSPYIIWGQEVINIKSPIAESFNIDKQVRMFWDHSGKVTWEELSDEKKHSTWEKIDSISKSRKGPGKYWVRFFVKNLSKDTVSGIIRCVRPADIYDHKINVFIESKQKEERQYAGRLTSFQYQAYPGCRNCLLLNLLPGEQKSYWIQLVYAYEYGNEMEFWVAPEEAIQKDRVQQVWNSLPSTLFNLFFLGVVFSYLLFAGVQFIQYREKAYGWYALYLLAISIHHLRNIEAFSEFGIIFRYFIESYYPTMVPVALLAYYAYFKFLDAFFDSSSYNPFHKFLIPRIGIGVVIYGVVDIGIRMIVGIRISMLVFDLMAIPLFLLTIYYLYQAYLTKSRLAFYIIIGTFFMVIGNILNVLLDNIFDFPFLSQQSIWHSATTYFRLGTMIEISFFSLGLGYKTRLALQQKYKMEQEIAESKHIMELDVFKRKFYTNITHEFRTPLTIILGMADQIKTNTKIWVEEGTNMINRNANHLLNLVNQMLDLNKLESGQLSAQFIQADIIDYAKYLLESFESYAETQEVQLDIEVEVPIFYMDYDPQKIQDIISNLLSNAIKFTPKGGRVLVNLSIRDDSEKAKQCLIISVQDSGNGISAAQLPYVFDRFYQAHDQLYKHKGTGIGLALTKELVKLLKGDIRVTSEEGKGSIFTVSLPISRKAQLIEPEYEVQKQLNEENQSDNLLEQEINASNELPLLLLIEDNADVRRYIDSLLASNYRLVHAKNGQEGIDKAREIIPDLIISDVMMPKKDGFAVCHTLKTDSQTSHIPIILLTAKAEMEAKLEGLEQGADAYLAKPFNKSELLIRIRKLLDVREQLKSYYLGLINPQIDQSPVQRPESKVENEFLLKARDIVNVHLADDQFSVKDFCMEIGMSHSQLHRKLVALTGYSTNRFIRFIRLTHAKSLIKAEGYSISEAAFATSYKDPSYFARVFRKEFGISPSDYKENQ